MERYIIDSASRSLLCPLQCGPGRDGQNKVLRDVDTSISVCMLLPTEDCSLHKPHCENSKPLICIFSYDKLFIWIQEHLLKPSNFLITPNVILLFLSDKLTVYSLWTFRNVSNLNPVKQWGCIGIGEGVKRILLYGMFHALIYIFTYFKAISPLIYIQKEKTV
jgi:hypothetical protein